MKLKITQTKSTIACLKDQIATIKALGLHRIERELALHEPYESNITITVDGETFHMSGFKGYKLIGVKAHTDSDDTIFCHMIADYLSGEEMQLARYEADGWGPSNLKAQQSDIISSDLALSALSEQFAYCKEQGQFPNEFWSLAAAFGEDINTGKYANASDAELKTALTDFQNSLIAAR